MNIGKTKVLVARAGGFIGHHLVKELIRKEAIGSVVRISNTLTIRPHLPTNSRFLTFAVGTTVCRTSYLTLCTKGPGRRRITTFSELVKRLSAERKPI
jgi:hypothetical protein